MEPEPRDSMIKIAIDFLTNPKVQSSTLNQKVKFLKSKGLSDAEIQIACERAQIFANQINSEQTEISMETTRYHYRHPTRFQRVRDLVMNSAFIGGLVYAAYLFYKRFIEPLLFGRKKKKSLEDKIDELTKSVKSSNKTINEQMISLREERERNRNLTNMMQNLKKDVEAVKGLLLSKDQFAATSKISTSIPSWQLQSQEHQEHENENKNEDVGSNSSETEIVTKNSDSSLEMM